MGGAGADAGRVAGVQGVWMWGEAVEESTPTGEKVNVSAPARQHLRALPLRCTA